MYKTLGALALAAAASAIPTPQSGSALGARPDRSELFALAMEYKGTFVTLNAISNTEHPFGHLVLQAGRPSVYPGTPAYFNGTGDYKALNLYLEEAGSDAAGVYGLGVEQVKDAMSVANAVFADYGFQEFEWKVDENGAISHNLTEALNRFYACEGAATEGENLFLKWGDTSDGRPPAGCVETRVIRDFNVPGGLKPSTT